ncbi:MAG: ABC transporter ATP-binding protein [Pseudomonadota bacterium]
MSTAPDPLPLLSLRDVSVAFEGQLAVDAVSIEVGRGEIVCLLGPSGCGKSTTLRVAAGVERQTGGQVVMSDRIVSDATRHLPPEAREIGLMFQDFALFPHLSVAENVAFGLRGRVARRDRGRVVEAELKRVGLADAAARYPHQLSGGEQQRVALARALAPQPRVMLMDEPFSGLDTRLRDAVREETLSLLREAGTAVMLVTHEPEEAMRMADRIALMRDGRIVQTGAPYTVYTAPVDTKAAAFFSEVNVIEAVVRDGQIDTAFGRFLSPGLAEGAPVDLVFRPQHLDIAPGDREPPFPGPVDGAIAEGTVVRARFVGTYSLIETVMADGSRLTATVPYAWLPEAGSAVALRLYRERCHLFPASGAQAAQAIAAAPTAQAAE